MQVPQVMCIWSYRLDLMILTKTRWCFPKSNRVTFFPEHNRAKLRPNDKGLRRALLLLGNSHIILNQKLPTTCFKDPLHPPCCLMIHHPSSFYKPHCAHLHIQYKWVDAELSLSSSHFWAQKQSRQKWKKKKTEQQDGDIGGIWSYFFECLQSPWAKCAHLTYG